MALWEGFRFQVGLFQSYLSCYPHFGGNADFRGPAVFDLNVSGLRSATYRLGRACETENEGGCEDASYQLQREIRATGRCQAAEGARPGAWRPPARWLFSQDELSRARWEEVLSRGWSQVVGNQSLVFYFLLSEWLPVTSYYCLGCACPPIAPKSIINST